MPFQVGDKVKIKAQFKGDKDWQRTAIIEALPPAESDCYTVNVGVHDKRLIYILEHDMVRYVELPDELAALKQMTDRDGPLALQLLTDALTKLLPGETAKIVNEPNSDFSIAAYHGAVTIDPVVVEQRRIGCIADIPGWEVNVWKSYPDTRDEPGGVDQSPQGTFPHYTSAVQHALQVIFKCASEDYWNHVADEAHARMVQEWDDQNEEAIFA